MVQERADDGEQHPQLGEEHPAAGGLGVAETAQPHDEEDGGEQVEELQQVALHYFRARNILRMRSVMRNPPTTLMVEAVTAMKPSAVLTLL